MPSAARVGDLHVCPMSTGPVPHVGGPVLPPGGITVLTENKPAARLADMATCVGPPDAIAIGSSGCLINNLLAARFGDATAHGGVVVIGAPTVFIGEAIGNVTMVRRGNIFLIVNRDLHVITMVGVQEYAGTGASQAYADSSSQTINNTWSGQTTFEGQPYTVESRITGRYNDGSASPNPMANRIDVVHTNDPPSVTGQTDPANQPYYGRTPGHQHDNQDSTGEVVRAHEFGHSMGLKDEYTEGPRNPDGTRSIVRTGPDGGLMGHIESGSRPTPDNFNSLITGNGLAP